jgi:hypothetical protein
MLCQRYIDVINDDFVGRQSGTVELDSINVGRRYKIKADAIIRYTNKDTE